MPRRSRKITRRSRKCHPATWAIFMDAPLQPGEEGYNAFAEFSSDSEWPAHREDVLSEWIPDHPCTRPSHWWRHDAPGEREQVAENLQESEAAFLQRCGLLTPAEARWLASHPGALNSETLDK